MTNRAINLALLALCVLALGVVFSVAPMLFAEGGYVQQAFVHVGTMVAAVLAVGAIRNILAD